MGWDDELCTRTFDFVKTYRLPSDASNIITTESDSSTEPVPDSDCCEASEGTDADLLEACPSTSFNDNEVFTWDVDNGICTVNFDIIAFYMLPSGETTMEVSTPSTADSTE